MNAAIMKWGLLSLVLFCLISPLHSEDGEIEKVVQKYGGWGPATSPKTMPQMAESDRRVLIQYYEGQLEKFGHAERGVWNGERYQAEHQLLKLGEPGVIEQRATIILTASPTSLLFRDTLDEICNTLRPEFLLRLAPAIYVDEPLVIERVGDTGAVGPRSYAISGAMFAIVSKSGWFNDETKKWAQENRKVKMEESLPLMRQWYRENEAAITSGNYQLAKPGRDLRSKQNAAERQSWNRRSRIVKN